MASKMRSESVVICFSSSSETADIPPAIMNRVVVRYMMMKWSMMFKGGCIKVREKLTEVAWLFLMINFISAVPSALG